MNDLISRREAIKAIESLPNCYNGFSDAYDKAYIIGTLEELPPAVEVVRCMDCKHWDAFDIHSTICPNSKRCKGIIGKMYTGPNFYCAYGEQKDE